MTLLTSRIDSRMYFMNYAGVPSFSIVTQNPSSLSGKSGPSSPHVKNATLPSSGPIRVLARHQPSLRRTWRLQDPLDAPPLPASTPIPRLGAKVAWRRTWRLRRLPCPACGPGTETSNLSQCGRCTKSFCRSHLTPHALCVACPFS